MPDFSTTQMLLSEASAPGLDSKMTPQAVSADHLAYIADMIAELQEIARTRQLDTLAAMLGLAGVEAARQAEQVRKTG